jgi:hypothetical protein
VAEVASKEVTTAVVEEIEDVEVAVKDEVEAGAAARRSAKETVNQHHKGSATRSAGAFWQI